MQRIINVLLAVVLTAQLGAITYDDHRETYYNLPMRRVIDRAQANGIYGEVWRRDDGCKMYGDFIICAADFTLHPYGSVVNTSLGAAIVLDTGTFEDRSTIDIAVDW